MLENHSQLKNSWIGIDDGDCTSEPSTSNMYTSTTHVEELIMENQVEVYPLEQCLGGHRLHNDGQAEMVPCEQLQM
jgi:hypothetical protein